jgi:ADP-ribose pyrophosphatase
MAFGRQSSRRFFVPKPVRVLESREIYRGRVIQLKVDNIIEPGRVKAVREVVQHVGSVVVLAHSSDGRIVLVRQYRYAVREFLWELVAGGLEPGERPLAAARRELLEETGYRAGKCRLLFDFFPSPGILTERMFLVEATGLTQSKASPDPDEKIEVGHFSLIQLRKMIRSRDIRDGKTLVGLMWLMLNKLSEI